MRIIYCFLAGLTILLGNKTWAQSNTDRDTDFTLDYGPVFGAVAFDNNGFPFTKSLPLSDGKVLFYGHFRNSFDSDISGVVRLNADGLRDASFDGPKSEDGYSLKVYAAKELPSGKILIAGSFTNADTESMKGILRLNADGSIDNTFNAGFASFNPTIRGLDVQSDGKILIVGDYQTMDHGNRITRLNADGSIDNTFSAGNWTSSGSASLRDVKAHPSGKIVVCGFFSSWDTHSTSGVAVLNADGSIDNTFTYSGAVSSTGITDDYPRAAVQSDGKIVVAGPQSGSTYAVRRYNTNLSLDGSFNEATNDQESGVYPTAIAFQEDGKILVSGYFLKNYGGASVSGIMRLNSDGTLDDTFDTESGFGNGPQVFHCAVQANGGILIVHGNSSYKEEGLRLNDGFPANQSLIRLNGEPQTTTSVVDADGFGEVTVYPNPATDRVKLNGLSGPSTIHLINIMGELILEKMVTDAATEVDLSGLSSGTYLLKAITDKGATTTRLLIY